MESISIKLLLPPKEKQRLGWGRRKEVLYLEKRNLWSLAGWATRALISSAHRRAPPNLSSSLHEERRIPPGSATEKVSTGGVNSRDTQWVSPPTPAPALKAPSRKDCAPLSPFLILRLWAEHPNRPQSRSFTQDKWINRLLCESPLNKVIFSF